jgi:hypothetical protein
MSVNRTHDVCEEICQERARQDGLWGEQNHPDGTGPKFVPLAAIIRDHARTTCNGEHKAGRGTWEMILAEEFWEAVAEEDSAKLRAELIQLAAVAAAWVEAIDRRGVQ